MSVWPRKLQGTREWIASKESLISMRDCCGTTRDVVRLQCLRTSQGAKEGCCVVNTVVVVGHLT